MKFEGLKPFLVRYLSSWVILCIDLTVSFVASAVALAMVSLFDRGLFASVSLPLVWLVCTVLASALSFYLMRTYRSVIRHTTLREIGRLFASVVTKEMLMFVAMVTLPWLAGLRNIGSFPDALLLLLDATLTATALVVLRIAMVLVYDRIKSNMRRVHNTLRVLVYGTGDKSVALVQRLAQSPHYDVVGFVVPDEKMSISPTIAGRPVYSFSSASDLVDLRKRYEVPAVLFAKEEDGRNEQERLVKYAVDNGMKVLIAPPIDEIIDGRVMKNGVREIKIEDLLGRDEIKISLEEIKAGFRGKTILVTGAAGSIGSELCRQLAGFGIGKLVMFDNAETPMHNVRLEFEERFPELDFVPVIGDVRIPARLDYVFRKYNPQVVFHAAAYKHVPLMEENPCEAVLVNVAGSRNVADKCLEYGAEKMVMISTDKAVNPTNIMGCTKRLAEIYVQSLGLALASGEKEGKTRFVTTRFGNVLGSNGSVIPRFREQIAKGGPVTVTHPEITRFFMTIPEACRLVMEAATMTTGNQIFVFDMGESVKIASLAKRMIELAGFVPDKDIKIEYTGLRPGEKLYEEVLSNTENTIPTDHDRIRIAKVREYSLTDAMEAVDTLEELSREVQIPSMVRLMKHIVPEFKSKNSIYEKFDREPQTAN
ncbi:MAG: polysaccharide biosynthesis protein [Muribaculum sp.]|nr:polysaccharide biosynthesis protein [Muribaculum sp.]